MKLAMRELIKLVMRELEVAGLILTAIRRPISTLANITPKKAPKQATKSNLSIFQSKIAA